MQAGQCGSQMGTKIWEVVRNEHGIGGIGKHCGNNNTQLYCINVLYHEASAASMCPALFSSTSSPA
jgi:hypothetical protein